MKCTVTIFAYVTAAVTRTPRLACFGATALAVLLIGAVPAVSQTLHVVEDATVDASSPSKNAGTKQECDVGSGIRCFVRFDLSLLSSLLPAPPDAGSGILKATLVLFANKVQSEGFIRVAPVDDHAPIWDEHTITDNTAPPVFEEHDATRFREITFDDEGHFVTVDVTEYLEFAFDFGPDFGLEIARAGDELVDPGFVEVAFDTKENTGTSHPAVIQVFLAPAPPD